MANERYSTDHSDVEWSSEAVSPGPNAARPPAGDPNCRLLRAEDRLPVEDVAARIPAVEDPLPLLQEVEDGRDPEGQIAPCGGPQGSNLVEVRVHSAKVRDQDGVRRLLEPARGLLPRLSHLWVDAGYRGRGKYRVEERLGLEVEIVNHTPKLPEKVLKTWAREWFRDGRKMDLKKLPERPAFEKSPRRWVAERTISWLTKRRSLHTRWSKKAENWLALIQLACAHVLLNLAVSG